MMFESDFTINGKHATYLKFLAKKNSNDIQDLGKNAAQLFERYIDVYMNAAIFGLLYSRVAKNDSSTSDRARIYADAFNNERENCVFLYRLVMLLDQTQKLSPEERVERAFKYDSLPEKEMEFKKNLELFHEYVRGGIEVMYERFTEGCQTQDDYLNRSHDVMEKFYEELNGKSYEDELLQMIS